MKLNILSEKFIFSALENRQQIAFALLPLVFVSLIILFKAQSYQQHDFANYYYGALLYEDGTCKSDFYDAISFNECLEKRGVENVFVAFYPNAPSIFYLYKPFLLFEPDIAKTVFNSLSILVFLLSLFLLASKEKILWLAYASLPVVFFLPLKNCIFFGQPYLLIIALLILSYVLLKSQKHILAACFLAGACLFKLSPILIFFYLILKKYYKTLLVSISIGLVFILTTGLIDGFEYWQKFIFGALPSSSEGLIYNGFDYRAKSAVILFKNLFVYDQLANPNPLINAPILFTLSFLVYKIILLFAGLRMSSSTNSFLDYCIWLLIAILFSPNLGTYIFVLLIPLYLSLNIQNRKSHIILSGLFFSILCNFPILGIQNTFALVNFTQVIMSTLLMAALYFSYASNKHKPSFFLLALFCIPLVLMSFQSFLEKSHPQDESDVLQKDIHQLIQNFEIENTELVYYHPSTNGLTKVSTGLNYELFTGPQVEIKNQQIYLNSMQLTFDDGHKKKALRVSDNEIIFLSDRKRAHGFYTLKLLRF